MIIEIYYKDPDAGSEAYNSIIKEKYPEIKPYSKEFWSKHTEFVERIVKALGSLARGDEDLYIEIDTDNLDIIKVNKNTYRLVTGA